MKALIIAGGLGLRLKPLTERLPKSLVPIGNRTILGRIMDSLVENGVSKMVFLLGCKAEMIKDFVKKNYSAVKPVFIVDPPEKPVGSRYIYSMWHARDSLKDDNILYIHGDTFFDSVLMKRLVAFPHSGALVHDSFASDKDFNALVIDGLIKKIGVKVYGEKAGFCLPVYKLLKKDFNLWMEKICEYVGKNHVDCYAEDALNEILDRVKLHPVYFEEVGMEIDDFGDLKKAGKLS